MPAKSAKQERFMQAVAHNPEFAKKAGVPMSVGKEFTKSKGGSIMAKSNLFKGKETMAEEMKEAKAIKSGKISPREYAKGEQSEGVGMKKGGGVKKYAAGGSIKATSMGSVTSGGKKGKGEHTIQERGLTKGKMVTMKKGGKC